MMAEKLSMTVEQLEAEMSVDEFVEWSIYLTIQSEEQEKQRKAAANGSGSNSLRNSSKGSVGRRS